MTTETVAAIARQYTGLSEVSSIQPVSGGFTGAEKYRLAGRAVDGSSQDIFLKVGNLAEHPNEAIALDTEAAMYGAIAQLPAAQTYFPTLHHYYRDDSTAALFLSYVRDATWGGPWNQQTIGMLSEALEAIHSVTVPPELGVTIRQTADRLQAKLYQQSEYSFDRATRLRLLTEATDPTIGSFGNSRGQTYHTATPSETTQLLDLAHGFDPHGRDHFTVWDMTYGNIGLGQNQAYIVDPVYVDLGVPGSDRARAGINILRILEQQAADDELIQLVDDTFLTDKSAVAYNIAYFIACSRLTYEGQADYMEFQQACAVAGLRAWHRLAH